MISSIKALYNEFLDFLLGAKCVNCGTRVFTKDVLEHDAYCL